MLELLHDAAFHLDRGGDDGRVSEDLAEVRRRIMTDDMAATWAIQFVERMEATLQRDAAVRQFEAEEIRADLHGSGCLSKDVHERFHRQLPPVGSPSGVPPKGEP
jgi:hypothetical protein